MLGRSPSRILILLLSFSTASAQIISKTTNTGPELSIGAAAAEETTYRLWQLGEGQFGYRSPLESPTGSVSALDLKAPGKARREYEKGYQLLQKKNLEASVAHLTAALAIYPSFVAAHNALGSAFLNLKQSDQARAEFSKAVALDTHLPGSFLNLACADLALKNYPAAEKSIAMAASMAPLDLHVLTALAYGHFMNQDYLATLAVARQIHARKHTGFAKVHLYAAAAWQALQNLPAAEEELEVFLREEPRSPQAVRVKQMLDQLRQTPELKVASAAADVKVTYGPSLGEDPATSNRLPEVLRKLNQASKENAEIEEAEAVETVCAKCEVKARPAPVETAGTRPAIAQPTSRDPNTPELILHASADEVAVFFTATDHRKSVTDLTARNVAIHDNGRPPAIITGFRNESQLPLRLGIVIDTSASVTERFRFEQDSAINFLQKVLTRPDDLAFVIGVSNSVLLVEDFTNDQVLLSRAVHQLAPAGGTALWDAVDFASDKLASRAEGKSVARLLVVLSDGQNNSSNIALKDAISKAQRNQVFVYTVSTKEGNEETDAASSVGKRALQTLAELTGGAAFSPGSIHRLNTSLLEVQQLIRSRYLISYKPAQFTRDGRYRPIDISAEKDGQKLRVFARKGYFASAE